MRVGCRFALLREAIIRNFPHVLSMFSLHDESAGKETSHFPSLILNT